MSRLYKFYNKCLTLFSSLNWNFDIYKYKYGKDLWSNILKNSINYTCKFLKKTNLFKYNNKFYYHRLYNKEYNKNITTDGAFPDSSYYRLIPKNKLDKNNVITHTYDVQNYIYKYQHPIYCHNKKFLVIRGFSLGGHGSEIHVITSYLSLALSIERIAVLDPYYNNIKAHGKYCIKEKNWLCFLEQLTNCSISHNDYIYMKKYKNKTQKEKYLYVENSISYRSVIPQIMRTIVNNAPIYKYKLLHYWRIQAVTYIFRLNKRTNTRINSIIRKMSINKRHDICFNIWIRHGDKYKEMPLLNSEDYLPSYNLYSRITNHNFPIYLSTDDPDVTNFFNISKKNKTMFLNFIRKNDNFGGNMKRGDEMTLIFIADIKLALHCEGFSGTRKSNVVRLIDELRSTVGLSANSLYFENGEIRFSDTSYEYYELW